MRRAILSALVVVVIAAPAHGALPPAHGGTLTLPAPTPVTLLDPLRADSHFEATLTMAVFDGLYELKPQGLEPVLAAAMPSVEGTTATIRLRPGVLHHGGRPLTARHVVRSLSRASRAPRAEWLLGAFATDERGRLAVREVDPSSFTLELARPGVPVARVLAAPPLAIVVGGDLGRRPLGTGPFRARLDGRGGVTLSAFSHAADAPPWLREVRFTRPMDRDDEVRAFELGHLGGSWWGRSLYGGEPVRPATTARAEGAATVLLVRRRAGALRSDARWAGVIAAVDRRRLVRVGLTPRARLAEGLPTPERPRGELARGARLRMLVRGEDPLEVRLAEALAGLLDERGVRLVVEHAAPGRYAPRLAQDRWDLRLARVRPPLPGASATVASALAACGQADRARALATALDDEAAARTAARRLDAMVLGDVQVVLHHRADLLDLELDARGRIPLAALSFARSQEAAR